MNTKQNRENAIAATYYIETDKDLKQVAEELVVLETTAKWMGSSSPTDLYQNCVGEVESVNEIEKGKGFITLLYPTENFDLEQSAFPCLWLSMIGGPTFALAAYNQSRLVDFSIPEAFHRALPGPAFGIEKTRQWMKLDSEELMIGTIVKPTAGLSAEEVAEAAYNAALGGISFIKDDEKMMNPAYCPLAKRVKLVSEALDKASQKTGKPTMYASHITTAPQHIIKNALTALENGATALMVNFFAAGFGSLQMLREHPEINVPIYAHCGGREAFGRAQGQGISPSVIVKMVRLLGGDYFRAGMYDSYLVDTPEDIEQMHTAATSDWTPHLPILPAVSGGLNPKTIIPNLEKLGRDNLYLAGSGVFEHPEGVEAGVNALRNAALTVNT